MVTISMFGTPAKPFRDGNIVTGLAGVHKRPLVVAKHGNPAGRQTLGQILGVGRGKRIARKKDGAEQEGPVSGPSSGSNVHPPVL